MHAGAPDVAFPRVAIVGLGLIGGSIAAALRARQPAVQITGSDAPGTLSAAVARGLIDHATADPADLGDHDLIVLATPIRTTIELLNAGVFAGARGVVTDVGSTKRDILAAAERGRVPRFVGGHPMAGSERSGLEHAAADLFVDRPWILVSIDEDAPDVGDVSRFASDLGATPSLLDADTHDRVAAYLSHAPQMLSIALMRAASRALGEEHTRLSGRAFVEMTRLAASDVAMWRDIVSTNGDNISAAIRSIESHVPSTDLTALRDAFEEANRARAALTRS